LAKYDRIIFVRKKIRKREDMLDSIFFAISNSTRRKILELLVDKDLYVNEISKNFSSSLPTISNHLKLLTECQLVRKQRESQKIKYSINLKYFEETQIWLETFGKLKLIDYENLEIILEKLEV
tara:strand:- start:477 stop:845 length:369 start_codon:yes stop_codon:yes gene_type:complete